MPISFALIYTYLLHEINNLQYSLFVVLHISHTREEKCRECCDGQCNNWDIQRAVQSRGWTDHSSLVSLVWHQDWSSSWLLECTNEHSRWRPSLWGDNGGIYSKLADRVQRNRSTYHTFQYD